MSDDRTTLTLVLDALIPPSADGRLPGAGALGVIADIDAAVRTTPALGPVIAGGMAALERLACQRDARGFAALASADRVQVLRELEAADPVFVPTLMMLTYVGYYGNPRVLREFEPELRAPHPRGHAVEPDDLTLLDAVRSRGKMYRDC